MPIKNEKKKAGTELRQASASDQQLALDMAANFNLISISSGDKNMNGARMCLCIQILWIFFKKKIKIAYLWPEQSARQDNHFS